MKRRLCKTSGHNVAVQTGWGPEAAQFEGPGHGSVVEDGLGDWWMVYAAWEGGRVNTWPPGRMMMLDKISW